MLEFVQPVIAITMFFAASYSDLKSRTVDDVVWLVFGAAGGVVTAVLLALDFDVFSVIYMVAGILIGIAVWQLRLLGGADGLGLAALSAVWPAAGGIPVAVVVLFLSAVLSALYGVSANVWRNISDRNTFADVDEHALKKIAAFFLAHKSRGERFAFAATVNAGGRTRFVFRHDPDAEFAGSGYVISAVPMMPFFAVSVLFLAVLYLRL